ncbi:MAG: sigma-70 family RNA polymerase sigma factor [Acidimicrobiales bacterium]|nr:sigma-70 family RNA polymerase sigma factor [Acidimicrobiales bacterium]
MAMTSIDERLLVEAHKSGDGRAFDEIVREYRAELHAHAMRRLQDPKAAEDAVQETFLRAYRALPRFNGQYHLRAWLYRILTNVCYDEGNRRTRDRALAERAGAVADPAAPGADEVIELDPARRRKVAEALASLPDSYRTALEQRYGEERSYSEIARAHGISEENARARVHRGQAALKRLLGGAVAAFAGFFPILRRSEKAALADPGGAVGAADPSLASAAAANLASVGPTVTRLAVEAAPVFSTKAGVVAAAAGAIATVAVPVAATQVADRAEPAAAPVTATSEQLPLGGTTAPLTAAPSVTTVVVEGTGPTAGAPAAAGPAASADPAAPAAAEVAAPEPGKPTPTTVPAEPAVPVKAPEAGPASDPATPPASPAPVPTAPTPGPGSVSASALGTADAGARVDLSGAVTLTVGGRTLTGSLSGKVSVGDPSAPATDGEPSRIDATLTVTLDDGSVVEVRVAARTAVATNADGTRVIDLSGAPARVSGGEAIGLQAEGTASGTITLGPGGGTSSVSLSIA